MKHNIIFLKYNFLMPIAQAIHLWDEDALGQLLFTKTIIVFAQLMGQLLS